MTEHVEISKRIVLINSVSAVVQKVGSVCVLIWLQQHLVRNVDTDEYALYAIVQSLMLFLPLLMLVMASSLGRFVVESSARGDAERANQVVSTAFPMCLAMAAVILAVGAALA